MKKHIFETTKISNLPNQNIYIEIKTLLSKTILGSSIFTIVLNHNLLEQVGVCWILKASYKT
jgi:hypothetical protein